MVKTPKPPIEVRLRKGSWIMQEVTGDPEEGTPGSGLAEAEHHLVVRTQEPWMCAWVPVVLD